MNSLFVHFALSVDPSLGRVDKFSLSQQTLMELFIENIKNKKNVCRDAETPKDISKWTDVVIKSNEVIRINWDCTDLRGGIALQWLPLSVKQVYLQSNFLRGTADLSCLPDVLEMLALFCNRFQGTVDLTALPVNLKVLYLHQNNFGGRADFSGLPKSLMELDVSFTEIWGEILDFEGNLRIAGSNVVDVRKKS